MTDITKENVFRAITSAKNKNLSPNIIQLLERFVKFIESNIKDIQAYEESNIRFCDYFDLNMHEEELTDFFQDNYEGDKKEESMNQFMIYCTFRNIMELLEIYELGLSMDETEDLEECLEETKKDIEYTMDVYKVKKEAKAKEKVDLSYIDENKYGIYFAGLSYKDIKELPKHALKALINKLSGELSREDNIHGAEGVDHVRDSYNVPLLRIQFADDYRVAFIRRKGTTIIVGMDLKSGKNSNYTRYDSVARKINDIYKEVDDYNDRKISNDSVHTKTIEYLTKFLLKEKKKNKDKNNPEQK